MILGFFLADLATLSSSKMWSQVVTEDVFRTHENTRWVRLSILALSDLLSLVLLPSLNRACLFEGKANHFLIKRKESHVSVIMSLVWHHRNESKNVYIFYPSKDGSQMSKGTSSTLWCYKSGHYFLLLINYLTTDGWHIKGKTNVKCLSKVLGHHNPPEQLQ